MNHTAHLRDEELLLALDAQRLGDVDPHAQDHLSECAACRSRLEAFAETDARVAETERDSD